jgi:hypothetical protein
MSNARKLATTCLLTLVLALAAVTVTAGEEGAAAWLAKANSTLDRPAATFAELTTLADSAARVKTDDRATAAEVELARLLAIRKAAAAIPFEGGSKSPYKEWIKARHFGVVYDEPSGTWLLSPELLWEVVDKYRDLPRAEAIAVIAATNTVGGECEGDVSCQVQVFNVTWGRYLRLFPAGAHASDALAFLADTLRPIVHPDSPEAAAGWTFGSTPAERQDLLDTVEEARRTVKATGVPQRDEVLKLLDAVEAKAK